MSLMVAVVIALGGVALPSASQAATTGARANLLTFGNQVGALGGQVAFGTGVAVNRTGVGGATAGDVYVTNFNNRRIEVFSGLGTFVRAFGIDVVASGQHEAGTGFEVCEAVSSPPDVCKAGTAGSAVAGAVTGVEGIAVDQATGNVFVASNANRRVDVFSATGVFQGAFGNDVIPANGPAAFEFCTTTCQAGVNAASAGAFATGGLLRAGLTVGPDGHVYVSDRVTHRINEFAPALNGSDQVTGVTFTRAIGWGVSNGAAELQTCTTTCQAGVTAGGAGDGQFPAGTPTSVAVDSSGLIYAASASGTCAAATNPCRIQKFNADGTFAGNFGPATGGTAGCQTTWNDGAANAQAVDGLAIDPANQHVFVTSKMSQNAGSAATSTGTYQLCEFAPDGTLVDTSPTTPITTNATGYLAIAIGPNGRTYVNNPISGAAGATYLLGSSPPPPGVTMDPVEAGSITATSADFEGTVTVPSSAVPAETSYHFEYSTDGTNWTPVPNADVSVGSTPGTFDVTQDVTGLAPNTVYLARLAGRTTSTALTPPVVFVTDALEPGIGLVYPDEVTQTEATLSAQINPRNQATSYYFEWGTTTAYGNRIPVTARSIGSGSEMVLAQETLTGLQPATDYHFRVVAINAEGPTTSDDQPFETLNECGYINDRCMELVSPADKGPVGSAGENVVAGYQLQYDVALGGTGIAYSLALGLPDSTAGGEVVHQASRTPDGWTSNPISPPILVPPTWGGGGGENIPSQTLGLSATQSCSVHWSRGPVAEGGRPGGADLYRRNGDGSYTLITNLPPINEIYPADYEIFGISGDCEKILFTTGQRYPGVLGAGSPRLYEWDEDAGLANVGVVPGPSALVPVAASPGAPAGDSFRNALSDDGSRVFFTATRQRDGDVAGAGENGKQALFVRQDGPDGRETVDVSESENPSIPNLGATYQIASKNGEHVFFLANYGLTGTGGTAAACNAATGAGCDLYRYDLADEDLVNLTARTNGVDTLNSNVIGVLDASADGSYVYFAARGQLVPGEGKTVAENNADNTYNVYAFHQVPGESAAVTKFVGVVRNTDLSGSGTIVAGVLVRGTGRDTWRSRATPDGDYLAFSSSANVTGYESGGVAQLYRYSYEDGETICASCRRDGEPAVPNAYGPNDFRVPSTFFSRSPLNPPSPITDDGRMFFLSQDELAPGALEGSSNLYEWEEGQVSLLIAAIPSSWTGATGELQFAGASRSGDDVYFVSRRSLVANDTDDRSDVYDARTGGGFDVSQPPVSVCDPLADASCQGESGTSPFAPSIESTQPRLAEPSLPPRASFSVATLSKAQRLELIAGRPARLRVRVSQAGTVAVTGRVQVGGFRVSVLRASRRASGAGTIGVPIVLSKTARRHVAKRGTLRVTLTVRFSATSRIAARRLSLAAPRAKKHRAGINRRAGS